MDEPHLVDVLLRCKARRLDGKIGAAVRMAVVLDVSGSMEKMGKLDYALEALQATIHDSPCPVVLFAKSARKMDDDESLDRAVHRGGLQPGVSTLVQLLVPATKRGRSCSPLTSPNPDSRARRSPCASARPPVRWTRWSPPHSTR